VEWTFPVEKMKAGIDLLQTLPYVTETWQTADERVKCRMDVERVSEANQALVAAHIPVLGFAANTVTLEDLFLMLTGGGENRGA
ncbi:hypothetical protein MXD63_39980, partial [Frankia sp. Cpl3]|nr:hypothetical protein [Frankia sp. Cpl3]